MIHLETGPEMDGADPEMGGRSFMEHASAAGKAESLFILVFLKWRKPLLVFTYLWQIFFSPI